ncbi:MAG TPA: Lrp/AsnC family transcriptional regulator [Beijerinckiaceae bacterium]|nr:Lrp/AsnC family transcriptional regulator [Beijerinckiaceae bacterium]
MLSASDQALIKATERGLPLTPDPYGDLARALDRSRAVIMERLGALLEIGAIRRIGVIPNHYALGVIANGMSVWDIDDSRVAELGPRIGALPFVSHCYRRPRHLPAWRYNVFAMVHGRSRDEVHQKVGEIAALAGAGARAHDVLFSSRILKKTGLRLTGQPAA